MQGFLSRIYAAGVNEMRAPSTRGPAPDQATLEARVVNDLKEQIGRLLKIKKGRLNEETSFADFGFDSIGLAQFSRVLTEHFGFEVAPSIFFSYSTIEKLTGRLIDQHLQALDIFYQPERADESTEKLLIREPQWVSQEREQERADRRSRTRTDSTLEEPIAIIGMSGRFPGADNFEELWDAMSSGKNMIEEIPRERWDWKEYFHSPGAGGNRIATNRGGFIRGLDEFDPLFFEISPREAQSMDPRQRLILQEAWRAFEDAGCAGDRVRGSACGVFIGVEEGDYGQAAGSENLATSNHNAILAARISYFLDLKGPSLAINTACSSGLVAVHYACQSLQKGDCEMALAGGVNVLTSPLIYVALSQSGMLSAEGECYAFDNRANGLVPGEAVAVVVLKALSKAVADGDLIYGVIKGSGVNYDGKTNGITAPSGLSQKMLIDKIYENCQVNIEDIGYVISHGTGTKLGDPVEVNSLIELFGKRTDKQAYCALGSTKPNVGHTFAASGMVSLVTMLMAFKHRQIPLSVNYERGNEFIDLENSSFYINKETRPWETEGPKKRLGAISAFGMSGTNAHLLIEEYVPIEGDSQAPLPTNHSAVANVIIPLSAKKTGQLKIYAENLLGYLAKAKRAGEKTPDLASIAYTLQTGREEMKHRVAFCVREIDELEDKLREYVDGNLNIAFCYRGQAEKHVEANADLQQIVEKITENSMDDQSLFDLAELWAKGNDFDWNCLYTARKPRKISLPTYPFRKIKYSAAIEKVSAKRAPANTGPESSHMLHPMVHEKLSM